MTFMCLFEALGNTFQNKDTEIENCIIEMQNGSKDATAKFYELTKASIYGFSLSILKNKEDAEDVLQDTVVKIFSSSRLYKRNGNPMPWILTIAKNFSLMKIRESQRLSYKDDDEWEKIGFTNDTLDEEDKYCLTELLGKLTDEERQIVILHAVTGLKHKDIAKLLDLKLSTCLSKYSRAIKKLQELTERR